MAKFDYHKSIPVGPIAHKNDNQLKVKTVEVLYHEPEKRFWIIQHPILLGMPIPDLQVDEFIGTIKACMIEQINSRVSLWENEDFLIEDEFDSFGHGTIKGLHNNDGVTCVLVDNIPQWICDGLEPIDELPVEDVYQIFKQLLSV